jgi:hypothetical protein
MSKSDKIEKIKKLLAKADNSRNSSEQEAAVAMEMAMSMMDSAGISMADIQASTMDDEFGEMGHSWLNGGEPKQMFNWKKVLIHSLAYFFDCELVNCQEGRKSKVDIIGRESNRITCEMFYNWIHDRTMKEAKERFGSQTAKRNAYCVGVAQGIKMKVFEIKPKAMASKANGWGIVPINEVKGYLRKIYPELRTGKITTTSSDRDAYAAGRIVGENTSLNNQFGLKAICA